MNTETRLQYNINTRAAALRCLVYCVCCGHFVVDDDYFVHRSRFDSYIAMYIKTGGLYYFNNNEIFFARKNELVLIDCYRDQNYGAVNKADFSWIHFDGAGVSEIMDVIAPDGAAVISGDAAKSFGYFIESFVKDYELNSRSMSEIDISKNLYSALVELVEPYINKETKHDEEAGLTVNAVNKFIASNYHEDISLDDMARFAEVSKSKLSKIYREITGQTPYDALIAKRIAVACHLLSSTNMRIGDISESVGYNSVATFILAFRKKTDMSPGEYREAKSGLRMRPKFEYRDDLE